jgi:hypothetical protein
MTSVVRTITAAVAFTLLLLPGAVMAVAWTPVNLVVSVLAVSAALVAARVLPRWKWVFAASGALLIAVPPYPYWLFASERRGWYLHFFDGYRSDNFPALFFAATFVGALCLFAMAFWAVGRRRAAESLGRQ